MKLITYALDKLGGISQAISRFLAVFLCLVTIVSLNAISIEADHDFEKQIITLVLGVFCFLCTQSLAERFGKTLLRKLMFYAAAVLVLGLYYIYILSLASINDVIWIKTVTGIFALFIAFIWIPSINRATDFTGIFLSVFKAFFTSAFFSGIIFGGIAAIIGAIDALLISINSTAYAHTANIVWGIWAPMLFLSLIPIFASSKQDPEKIKKSIGYPKFLEILLSYVVIPLISIYTVVLLIYISKTVFLGNWDNNLLEPLIISYLIAVLLIYILVKGLDNIFTKRFRMIFPLLLAAIALFQTVSSVITITNQGIIYSRYFVIMFSLYAIICGITLFAFPKRKNDIIAWLAIILALVCITPLVGAFRVSINSQSAIVENTLEQNNMLADGSIIANSDISDEDKEKITGGVEYLSSIDELDSLMFLPNDFDLYADFNNVFGFDLYDIDYKNNYPSKDFQLDPMLAIEIGAYDYLSTMPVYPSEKNYEEQLSRITIAGEQYLIKLAGNQDDFAIIFYHDDTEIMAIPLIEMFNTIANYSAENGIIDPEKLTFDFENDLVKARIVFRYASIYYNNSDINRNGEIYILYSIK